MNFKQLRAELDEDVNFTRLRQVYTTCQKALNIERTESEIRAQHAGRSSRTLTSGKMSITALQKATSEDLAARSRLTEIQLMVYRTEELLAVSIKSMRKYIASQYRDELIEIVGNTKTERDALVERVLSVPIAYLSSLSVLSKQIDSIIKDIDQASYGLNRLDSLLKMQLDKKEAHL